MGNGTKTVILPGVSSHPISPHKKNRVLTILHFNDFPVTVGLIVVLELVDESVDVVVEVEGATTVGGLKHAQPLEILEARDLHPLAIAVGVGVGRPAW